MCLCLTGGFPFFSVKVTNRGTRVCKAIVDAIMPTWADIDCSPHKLLVAPLIHYTRCLPKWSGAGSATPSSMMLMGSPACLIFYTLHEKNTDIFTVIFFFFFTLFYRSLSLKQSIMCMIQSFKWSFKWIYLESVFFSHILPYGS